MLAPDRFTEYQPRAEASRGIAPDAARALLVRAFVADAFAAHGEPDALLDAALGALGDMA